MTDACYFDLRDKIFALRKKENLVPMLSGTFINWGNSWMTSLIEFGLQCCDFDIEVRYAPIDNYSKKLMKHIYNKYDTNHKDQIPISKIENPHFYNKTTGIEVAPRDLIQ